MPFSRPPSMRFSFLMDSLFKSVWKARTRLFLTLGALAVPMVILGAIMNRTVPPLDTQFLQDARNGVSPLGIFSSGQFHFLLVIWAIYAVAYMVLQPLISGAALSMVGGKDARQSLRLAVRRWLSLWTLGLLYVLALVGIPAVLFIVSVVLYAISPIFILLGLLLGVGWIVFGVWFYISASVSVPAVMAEGLGPIRALRRSFGLVSSHFWSSLGYVLLVAVVMWVIGAALSALGAAGGGYAGLFSLSSTSNPLQSPSSPFGPTALPIPSVEQLAILAVLAVLQIIITSSLGAGRELLQWKELRWLHGETVPETDPASGVQW